MICRVFLFLSPACTCLHLQSCTWLSHSRWQCTGRPGDASEGFEEGDTDIGHLTILKETSWRRVRDYKDFPIKVTISLGIVNEIQKGRTAKLAEQISKHLTLDHENYVQWKLDIWHWNLDFEDTGRARFRKTGEPAGGKDGSRTCGWRAKTSLVTKCTKIGGALLCSPHCAGVYQAVLQCIAAL